MQLEIVSKEIIKPFRSTPPELRRHYFSFFDQKAPYLYLQCLYFYENKNNNGSFGDKLKLSLSKALSFYYPFAGRLRDGVSVDCNDGGVPFLEAKLRCGMSEIKDNLRSEDGVLKLLCCNDLNGKDQRLNPLFSVQLTEFECGGHAICVLLSHKLADAATFVNFMNDWASIERAGGGAPPPPSVSPFFNGASFFRPDDDGDRCGGGGEIVKRDENIVTRRFVFKASKIAALKDMVCEKVENPTCVEVLSALLYRAAISAASSCSAGGQQPVTSFLQTINLRNRVDPPLPETLSGNIISYFIATSTTGDEGEIELWKLVGNMKGNKEEFCNKYPKKCKLPAAEEDWASLYRLHMKESMEWLSNGPPDQVVYACSSWCGFPLYNADFGWGKPSWVTAPLILQKNVIIFMDSKDGAGVEALVSLDTNQMAALERNQDLLSFCHLQP